MEILQISFHQFIKCIGLEFVSSGEPVTVDPSNWLRQGTLFEECCQ